jgi:hypothetical protein
MRSFGNLTTAVKYALIDKELSDLLLVPENRDILKIALLDKYFPDIESNFGTNSDDDLHRAFDRDLISMPDDYTVSVNRNFAENQKSAFNISQFAGKTNLSAVC